MTTDYDATFRQIRRQLNWIKWMLAITIAPTFAAFCRLIIFAVP